MSIQRDVKDKLQEQDSEYAALLISFIQEIDDKRVPITRVKERLHKEITEWVLEEE